MSKNKKESFFWTSYSDLMTSLFFVMMLLFVLTIVLLHNKMVELENEKTKMKGEPKPNWPRSPNWKSRLRILIQNISIMIMNIKPIF